MSIKDKPSWIIGGALIVVAVIAGLTVRANASEPGSATLDPPAGTLSAADARAEIDYIQVLDRADKTPDRWLPAPAARCEYARMYVTVLKAYELPALAATRTALADTLRDCA
jgi:hypothetical protein